MRMSGSVIADDSDVNHRSKGGFLNDEDADVEIAWDRILRDWPVMASNDILAGGRG